MSEVFHTIADFLSSNPIARAIVQIVVTAVLVVTGVGAVIAAAAGAAITTGLSEGNLGQALRAGLVAGV